MINWYKKVVFDNYANFSGRARRKELWYFLLFNYILLIIAAFIDSAAGFKFNNEEPYGYVYLIIVLASLVPSIAVQVRRMHDVGKSGWLILIPIYNLIMYCTDGDFGSNEYGPNPKSEGDEINEIGTE